MSFPAWRKNGWLTEHKPSAREISDLLSAVDRDIKTSAQAELNADWRFAIAYNAALQAANAALAASGFRAAREAHHFRVIQSLTLTIGLDQETVDLLDHFRRKRHLSAYEKAGTVSDREAGEMRDMAVQIRDRVIEWLKSHHPDLIETT